MRRRYDADAVQAVPANVVKTLAYGYCMKGRSGFKGSDRLVFAGGVAYFKDVSGWHDHATGLKR
jgi:hypothetical protein